MQIPLKITQIINKKNYGEEGCGWKEEKRIGKALLIRTRPDLILIVVLEFSSRKLLEKTNPVNLEFNVTNQEA